MTNARLAMPLGTPGCVFVQWGYRPHLQSALIGRRRSCFFPLAALTGRFPLCSTKLGNSGHLSHAKCQGRELQGSGEMGVWYLCGHSWCSFPHLKGSAKAEEGWRLRDSQERKIPIKAIRPHGRPYLAAVWFPPGDIDISSHKVPLSAWRSWNGLCMLENGSLCGIQEREWA